MTRFVALLLLPVAVSVSIGAELKVVVEEDVSVPMRDGTILRADVYRPDRPGKYPVLVQRTPYGKSSPYVRRTILRFVKAGYIVVSQDARGRFASDGYWESNWRFETHDAQDGYDTVQWAAQLDESNGKVGTFGVSYDAFLQWRLAPLRPPALGVMSNRWDEGESEKWLKFLPWLDLPRTVFEDETEAVHFWLRNPHTDPWQLDKRVKDITVPNLNVVGWFDHCNGELLLDRAMRLNASTNIARQDSRTIIGPWSHFGLGLNWGEIKFGSEATLDLAQLQIEWFDHWLKGTANGVDKWAPYRIFVMGDNRWRDEQQWPLARAKERVFYFTSGGKANTPSGDGRLVDSPLKTTFSDSYAYDPKDPVPTLYDKWRGVTKYYTTTTDQRLIADREDILVYQSEPLADRFEVTGNPKVELFAASSAFDTDWVARLIDVAPDGTTRNLSMGLVRARYRNGLDRPELLEPGKVVKYMIRMAPMSNAFLPGHRIRVNITSSDFPNYDRNHNTAADQNADATLKTAVQTIFHGGDQCTRILLPGIVSDDPNKTR